MLEDELRKARQKYATQKGNAKRRGIEWRITFPEWVGWWGEDYFRRGSGHDKLQMQRFHDKGPYALGNIQKGYPRQNSKTRGSVTRLVNTAKDNERRIAAMDSADVCESKDWRPYSDDEWEIIKDTGARMPRASFLI
jgi:hypothetical protein